MRLTICLINKLCTASSFKDNVNIYLLRTVLSVEQVSALRSLARSTESGPW